MDPFRVNVKKINMYEITDTLFIFNETLYTYRFHSRVIFVSSA